MVDMPPTETGEVRRQATFDRRYRLLELKERRADRNLKRDELETSSALKEKEISASQGSGIRFSSAQATVAAAVIALLSGTIGGTLQGYFNRDVEANKSAALLEIEDRKAKATIALEKQRQTAAEQLERAKFETTLILKATEALKRDDQIRNLKFFLNAGFITDPSGKIARMDESSFPSTPAPFPARAPDTGIYSDSRIVSDPLSKRASLEAMNIMISTEIGSKAQYEKNLQRPRHSAGGGLMIGFAYDLGFVTLQVFESDWGDILKEEDRRALAPAVGERDSSAVNSLEAGLAGIAITWDQAVTVFLTKTLPKVESQLRASLPNLERLPPQAYGALLSLAYNRGTSFKAAGDRYLEMRSIRDAMERGDFESIPGQLRSMKRLFSAMPGLVRRRELEATLFEKAFAPVEAAKP